MERQFRLKWTVLTAAGWAGGLFAALALRGADSSRRRHDARHAGDHWPGRQRSRTRTVVDVTYPARSRLVAPATAVGVGIGLTLGITFVEQVGRWFTGGPVNVARLTAWQRVGSFATIGLVTGLCLGVAQWLVLRRFTKQSRSWPITSAVAMAAALMASSFVTDSLVGSVAAPLGFGVFALLSGCAFGALSSFRLRMLLSPQT